MSNVLYNVGPEARICCFLHVFGSELGVNKEKVAKKERNMPLDVRFFL